MDFDFLKHQEFYKAGAFFFKDYVLDEKVIFELKNIIKSFLEYNNNTGRYECNYAVHFENAVINWSFIIEDIDFNKGCYFDDCCFNAFVKFLNVRFKDYVSFNNTAFQYADVLFANVVFENAVSFSNTSFRENMANIYVKEYAAFDRQTLLLQNRKKEIIFDAVSFNRELEISTIKFSELMFKNSEIRQFNNTGVNSHGDLKFFNCSFETVVVASHITEKYYMCNIDFENSVFINNADFSNTIFEGEIGFKNVVFQNVNFSNVNFGEDGVPKTVYFSHAQFLGSTYFKNIKLYAGDCIDFSSIMITNFFEFIFDTTPLYLTGALNFSNLQLKIGGLLKLYNINIIKGWDGVIIFEGALIEGILNIRDVYINKLSFDGTFVTGGINVYNLEINTLCNRSTYRLLKHEAIKCNDYVNALIWKENEMLAYTEELIHKDDSFEKQLYSKRKKIILKEIFYPLFIFRVLQYVFTKRGDEKVLLFLNKYSNDYGLSWVRSIFFTIWMSIIFYSLFFIASGNVIWGRFTYQQWIIFDNNFWIGYTNYLWLPDGFDELVKNNLINGGLGGWLFFIIGKILIAYGIYQTISAFRKYGK